MIPELWRICGGLPNFRGRAYIDYGVPDVAGLALVDFEVTPRLRSRHTKCDVGHGDRFVEANIHVGRLRVLEVFTYLKAQISNLIKV